MKYVNGYERIFETHRFPYRINKGNFIVFFISVLSALSSTILACINGWGDVNEQGESIISNYGGFALISLIILFVYLFGSFVVMLEYPFEKKDIKRHFVPNFKPEFLHHKHYKEAYDDLIQEIESGTYENYEWDQIFSALNTQAYEFAEKEKIMKKKRDPRRDYAAEFKESNDMYFKGLQ